jgi:hypothetical protein
MDASRIVSRSLTPFPFPRNWRRANLRLLRPAEYEVQRGYGIV